MQTSYVSIPSNDSGAVLHVLIYAPSQTDVELKGLIQICHGMTEHMERYKEFAEYFTSRGYIMFGNDIASHGKSVTTKSTSLYFDDWFNVVKDVTSVKEHVIQKYLRLPVYLLGFSLGSFVVRSMTKEAISGYEKEILIGTGCQPAKSLTAMRRFFQVKYRKRMDISSDEIKNLAFDSYDSKFPGKPSRYWLLTDNEKRKEYEDDVWVETKMSPGFFCEFLKGMSYTSKMLRIGTNNVIPTLFLYGKEDPVADFGKKEEKVFDDYCKRNNDVEMKAFSGSHDILHDKGYEEVFDTIKNYIA